MAKIGVLIEMSLLLDEMKTLAALHDTPESQAVLHGSDTLAQLQRLDQAGVGLALVSQQAHPVDAAFQQTFATELGLSALPYYPLAVDSPASWQWPKPAQLLRACSEQGFDIFNSWVIGESLDLFRAASQAGLLGGVCVGSEPAADKCGLQVLNQAASLADAPRVMIPPKGGCWHEK